MDSKIDHHHFPVASQLLAKQIVLDASDQGPSIIVLVIDAEASRRSVEVHTTDHRSLAQLITRCKHERGENLTTDKASCHRQRSQQRIFTPQHWWGKTIR